MNFRNVTLIVAITGSAIATFAGSSTGKQKPTYHGAVEKIVQQNCVSCHRKDGIAPFSLETFDQVHKFGPTIKRVVQAGTMPPWFAKQPKGEPSPWINDRTVSEADRSKLVSWIDSGMAKGKATDATKPLRFNSSWEIGKPDAVFKLPEPIAVKADGYMNYQYVKVPVNYDADRWLQAVEVRPGNRAVVHHVLVFLVPHEGKQTVSGISNSVDYFAIFVPGQSAVTYPSGFGRKIPKGYDLRFQIHYTPNGAATTDQTEIGFKFATNPPEHEVKTASVLNFAFQIPPGAANHQVTATKQIPRDINIVSFLPHSHLRGKAARYELIDESGAAKTLLDVPRYDFNWQLQYNYRKPLLVKEGSTLRYTAWYDNSATNPANPDPTKSVTWGDQTYNEMMLGYVVYYEAKK